MFIATGLDSQGCGFNCQMSDVHDPDVAFFNNRLKQSMHGGTS